MYSEYAITRMISFHFEFILKQPCTSLACELNSEHCPTTVDIPCLYAALGQSEIIGIRMGTALLGLHVRIYNTVELCARVGKALRACFKKLFAVNIRLFHI
jgi:hypothetical protein